MALLKMTENNEHKKEELHINATMRTMKGFLYIVKYIDKDTNHYVGYCPSLDISAYGETHEQMQEMMRFCLVDFFKILIDLPTKKLEQELYTLGWKHDKLKNKDYSKSYVDCTGELQNFAVANSLTEELVTV